MDYYELFFNLSEQYDCLNFSFSTNYDDYELLKIVYEPMIEFDSPIVFDVDPDSGKDELDLNLSRGGVLSSRIDLKMFMEKRILDISLLYLQSAI